MRTIAEQIVRGVVEPDPVLEPDSSVALGHATVNATSTRRLCPEKTNGAAVQRRLDDPVALLRIQPFRVRAQKRKTEVVRALDTSHHPLTLPQSIAGVSNDALGGQGH